MNPEMRNTAMMIAALGGLAGLTAIATSGGSEPENTRQEGVGRTSNNIVKPSMGYNPMYGAPLTEMESLDKAASLQANLYKYPDRRDKTMRDLEIEAQLTALQSQALMDRL
jgi:hypothetical protein